MNNQIDLTIIPENANENYDLNLICETADSIYWTLEMPDEITKAIYNNIFIVSEWSKINEKV